MSRVDIVNLMKLYAEKENIMVQPKRMPIPSFILTHGTIITHLLLFYFYLAWFIKRFNGVLKTLPETLLALSYSLSWIHNDKEIPIQIRDLLPRL